MPPLVRRVTTTVPQVSGTLLPHLRRARDHIDWRYAAERPYGVEAVIRDSSRNWQVLVEKQPG